MKAVKNTSKKNCVVPENIHTPTTEGYWKSEEEGDLKRPNFLKESMSLNWNFQRGGGFKAKNPLWGHIVIKILLLL